MTKIAQDKAGKEFWDDIWQDTELPVAADPHSSGIKALYYCRMDAFFREAFSSSENQGKTLLEVGCALSVFLPYFNKEFGFKITGLDYSELGCEQEKRILQKANVNGEIICGNFFDPPANLLNSFDYVFSNGVAEHFTPTEDCLSAFAAFLKPGGALITLIPNLTSSVGWLMKTFNRPFYDVHVVMDDKELALAHEKAELEVTLYRYFLSSNFLVANVHGLDQSSLSTKIKKYTLFGLGGFSRLIWFAEDKVGNLPATKAFSPYVICVARKPISTP